MGVSILPWRWHILSIPLEAGRGISAEICGLDEVFPIDDIGSGPYTQFIILVIEITALTDIYIPIISVANDDELDDMILLFILSCLVSNVSFNCIVQDSRYHNMDIGTMCDIVFWSVAPHHSL